MTQITRENLAQAAQQGAKLAHLTEAQAWAAAHLKLAPEQLAKPLRPHIAVLLERTIELARSRFIEGVDVGDPLSIISRAHDPSQPAFLRFPLQAEMKEAFHASFPDLKPTGVIEDGTQVYCLDDVAAASGVSVDQLLALAREMGVADRIHEGPVHASSNC